MTVGGGKEISVAYADWLQRLLDAQGGAVALSEEDSYRLGSEMFDGGVPELEMGAILLALRGKGLALEEWLGFYRALTSRVHRLRIPGGGSLPMVLSSQRGALLEPNLLPLLALAVKRFGIPVLVHGSLHGGGRVACVHVFRELGILPCATLSQAQSALDGEGFAFVPTPLLAPGLGALLALRARLGIGNFGFTLAKLIDPFAGASCRLVSVSTAPDREIMRSFFLTTGERALLLEGTEDEAFANPRRRPQIEFFAEGEREILFEPEVGQIKVMPGLPSAGDAVSTAAWTRQVLGGEVPLPMPIVNQLACCLYASGYAEDMNQAKAIVAVKSLAPA